MIIRERGLSGQTCSKERGRDEMTSGGETDEDERTEGASSVLQNNVPAAMAYLAAATKALNRDTSTGECTSRFRLWTVLLPSPSSAIMSCRAACRSFATVGIERTLLAATDHSNDIIGRLRTYKSACLVVTTAKSAVW